MNQLAPIDYGPEAAAMQAYLRDGEARAAALGNRGPIRFGATGRSTPRSSRPIGAAASMSSRACWAPGNWPSSMPT